MIFHASVPADDPEKVARVLGELLGGGSSPFHVGRHSFMARGGADDEHRTGIEVYPRDEVMMPGIGEDEMVRQAHLENPPRYGCFHLAVATKLSKEEVIAIGKREGWRVLHCSRGRFDVVEFWLENSLMIEFLTPEMQAQYKALMTSMHNRPTIAPAA
ncbi:MAG TPA: hypothetical protein VLV50_11750 [Stellaceae bacterium]|nr:hypothetical protein [Stellaceae bacterium]